MAAVTKGVITKASPAGESIIRRGEAAAAIAAGDPVMIDSVAPRLGFETRVKAATSEVTLVGVALNSAAAGELLEFVVEGLVGGYVGLTAGTWLSVASNKIDSTAATGASKLLAYNATVIQVG